MSNINTTQSMKKLSNAYADKIEYTEKNMDALLSKAGCAKDVKKTRTRVPFNPFNQNDDVLFLALNGVNFYFRRGETVMLADPLAELMGNCGEI